MHIAYNKLIPFNMKYPNIFNSFRYFGWNYLPFNGKIWKFAYCAGLPKSHNPAHRYFCRKAAQKTKIPEPNVQSGHPALNFAEFRDSNSLYFVIQKLCQMLKPINHNSV